MGKRILIVDDEKAIRWSLGEALTSADYEVVGGAERAHGGQKVRGGSGRLRDPRPQASRHRRAQGAHKRSRKSTKEFPSS